MTNDRNHVNFKSETRRRLKFVEDNPSYNITPNESRLNSPNNQNRLPIKLPGLKQTITYQDSNLHSHNRKTV